MYVRSLFREDLSDLIPLMKRAWYASFVDFRQEDESLKREILSFDEIEQQFSNQPFRYDGLFDEDENLIGFSKYKILAQSAFLCWLFISEHEQENGYDKLMLKTCIENIIDIGIFSMKVELEELNYKAIEFYQSIGFTLQPNKILYPSTGPNLHYNVSLISLDLRFSLSLIDETYLEDATHLSLCPSAA